MTGRPDATAVEAARGVHAATAEPRLTLPIVLSAVLHGGALAALLFWRPDPPPPAPPVYSVRLEAAPPGERAVGAVTPEPPAAAPAPPAASEAPTPPPRAETKPTDMPMPTAKPTPPARKPAPPATPSLPTPRKAASPAKPASGKAAPTKASEKTIRPPITAAQAGGGPTGGRGTDVANVDIRGITFPYPGYLANIVRQIQLNFKPRNPNAPLQADVRFLIHRDGSVSDVRVVKGSGNFAFDLEARGAVEAAGSTRSFGRLPDWFKDDVLPVTFSFDPTLNR